MKKVIGIFSLFLLVFVLGGCSYKVVKVDQSKQVEPEAKQRQDCYDKYTNLFKDKSEINDPLNYDKTNPSLYTCLNNLKNPLGI